MKRLTYLASLSQVTLCLLLTLAWSARAQDKKVDPAGTWTWTVPGRDGQTRTVTLKLKMEGDKLAGNITGRNGDIAIEEAKLKGEDISFQVVREFNGNKVTTKYAGKLSGDTIKGKSESDRGQNQSRDWEAKRGEPKKE